MFQTDMGSDKINQCIEALCNHGCGAVRATINNLEMGIEIEQTRELNKEEMITVLNELKTIMAVYDECP